MEDFEKRMVDELKELEGRYEKLDDFIDNNPTFKTLDYDEQIDLRRQREGMRHYHNALRDRCLRRGLIENDEESQTKYLKTK